MKFKVIGKTLFAQYKWSFFRSIASNACVSVCCVANEKVSSNNSAGASIDSDKGGRNLHFNSVILIRRFRASSSSKNLNS